MELEPPIAELKALPHDLDDLVVAPAVAPPPVGTLGIHTRLELHHLDLQAKLGAFLDVNLDHR